LAPEQVDEAHSVDGRADQYSLGCTLYKLLGGQAPFADAAHDTMFKKFSAHRHEPAPALRLKRPDAPEQLTAIVDRLLAKDPAQRFASMGALAQALQPLAAGADLIALCAHVPQVPHSADPGSAHAAPTPESTRSAQTKPTERLRRWYSRLQLAWCVALVTSVVGSKTRTEFGKPWRALPPGVSQENRALKR